MGGKSYSYGVLIIEYWVTSSSAVTKRGVRYNIQVFSFLGGKQIVALGIGWLTIVHGFFYVGYLIIVVGGPVFTSSKG